MYIKYRYNSQCNHEEFLLFYPTLLLYYDQTIASLDHNRAESVRRQCNISGFSIHNSKTNNHLL